MNTCELSPDQVVEIGDALAIAIEAGVLAYLLIFTLAAAFGWMLGRAAHEMTS